MKKIMLLFFITLTSQFGLKSQDKREIKSLKELAQELSKLTHNALDQLSEWKSQIGLKSQDKREIKSIKELAQELGKVKHKAWNPFFEWKSQTILNELKSHPDASKPLSQITEQQAEHLHHDAVYVKFNIFKFLLAKENTLKHLRIKNKHNAMYDCEAFDQKYTEWVHRNHRLDNTVDVQYFWSPRFEINQDRPLSKGTLSASRYYADTVHKGCMWPRDYQYDHDEPFNPDLENKFTMLDLLSIVEQAEMQSELDWQRLDNKVDALTNFYNENHKKFESAYPELFLQAQSSRNPKAAFIRLCPEFKKYLDDEDEDTDF